MRWWWLSVLVLVLSGVAFAFQGSERTDDDDCPCMPMDQCPRKYGQSAMDVRELGFIKPCRQYGTVRCCGVTIRIEHEKDEDRQVISRPIRLRSSALKRDSITNKGQTDLEAAGTQTSEATQEASETPSPTPKIRPLLKFRRRKVEPSLRSVANESQVATPVEDPKQQPEVQQSPVPTPPRLKGLTLPRTLRKPSPSPPAEIVNITEKLVPEEVTPAPSPVVSLLPKSRPSVSPIFKLRRPGGLKVGIQVESALPTTVDVLSPAEKVRGNSANRKDSSKTVIELDIKLPKPDDTRSTPIPSLTQSEPTPVQPRPRPAIRRRPTNKASELIGLGTSTESVFLEPVTPAPTETTTSRLQRPIRPGLRRRPVTPAPVVDTAVEIATPVAVSSLFESTPAPYVPAPARYYPKPETTPVPERRPKYKLRRTTTTTTERYEETTANLVNYEPSSTTEITTTSSTTTAAPETTQAPVAQPTPEPSYERYPTQEEVRHQFEEAPPTGAVNYNADHEEPIKIQIQSASAVIPQSQQTHFYIGGSQIDERIVTISQSTPLPPPPSKVAEEVHQVHYDSYSVPDRQPVLHEPQPRPQVHNPNYEYEHEEPRQPVQVTSTYARIRHGDGHRPEEYQRPAPTYYAPSTQRPTSSTSSAKPQRRFQAPNRFSFTEDDGSYVQEVQEVVHHTPEWKTAENYDLVVDKEVKKPSPAPHYHQSPPQVASYVYTRKPAQQYEEETYSHSQHADMDDYADEYEEFQEESRVNAEYVKPDEIPNKSLDTPGDEEAYVVKPKRKRVRVSQKPVQAAEAEPTPAQPTTSPQYVDTRAQILNRKRFQAKLPPLSPRKSMQRVKAEKEKPTLVYPDTSEHLESPAPSTPLPRRKKVSQRYPSVITAQVVSSPAPAPTTSYTEYYNHQIPPTEPTTERTTSTTPIPPSSSSAGPDTRTTTLIDIQGTRNKESNYEASVQPTQFQFRQPQGSSYEIRQPVQKAFDEVRVMVEDVKARPQLPAINASPDSMQPKEETQLSKESNPSVFVDIVADRGQLKHEAQNSEEESPQVAQVKSEPQTFSEFSKSQNSVSLVEQPTPFNSHLSGPAGAESGSQSGSAVVPSSFQTFINIVSEPSKAIDSIHSSSSRPTGESLKSSPNTQSQTQNPWTMPHAMSQAPAPLKPELPHTESSRPESGSQFQVTNFGEENVEQSNFGSSTQERQRTSGSRPRDPDLASLSNSAQRQNSAPASNQFLAPATNSFPAQASGQFPAPASEQFSKTEQHQLKNDNVLNKFPGSTSSQNSEFTQTQFSTQVQPQPTGNFMGSREQERIRSVPSSEDTKSSNSQFQAPQNAQFEQFQPKQPQANVQRQPDIQVNVQGQPMVSSQGQFNWQPSSLETAPAQAQSQLPTPSQDQFPASSQSRLPAQSQGQFTAHLKGQLPVLSQGQLPASLQGRFPMKTQEPLTVPSQGQSAVASKAKSPAQFQREFAAPSRGQFASPSQGQFVAPSQGQLSAGSRGQFGSPPEGQFSAPSKGQSAAPSQGQFATPSRGQFSEPSQGQFASQTQGQFGAPSQAQSASPSRGQFSSTSQGQFSSPPQGQFGAPSQAQSASPSRGQFFAPSQGQFSSPPQGQFAAPPRGQFSANSQGQLSAPSQGQFGAPSRGQFPSPSQGQLAFPSQGQFAAPSQGQLSTPSRGQFSAPSQGQFTSASQGQSAAPSRGQFLTQSQQPAQTRPQPRPNSKGQFSQERTRSKNAQNLTPPQAPPQFLSQKPQVDISFNPNEFNSQFQPRQPIKSQPSSNDQPEYLREYENHQFFTQQILSQLQNTVRKARAANLTDSELDVLLQLDKEMRTNSSGLIDAEVRSEITALSRSLGLELEEEEQTPLPVPDVKSNEDNSSNVTVSVDAALNQTQTAPKNETQIPEEIVSTEATTVAIPAEANAKAEVKSEIGAFRAPKTIQRGFFPILPYSEDDPGLLLVSMNTNSRSSRALTFPPQEKVYVSLTHSS